MSLRFLATGDLQAHNWQQFATTLKNGMNSRLANCLRVLKLMRREAKRRGITKALINGDVFEETDYIPVEVYDGVYVELEKCADEGLDIAINIGNHDIALQSPTRTLHSIRPFRKVAHVIDSPEVVWDSLGIVPYVADVEDLKRGIKFVERHGATALALHVGIHGSRVGPKNYVLRSKVKLRDIYPSHFKLVVLSDYHTQQSLRSNVFYLGSPLQHTFGETHKPCLWDITLSDKKPVLEKIYTNLPRFRSVSATSVTELEEKTKLFTSDYVRVRISGSLGEADVERVAKRVGFKFRIEQEVLQSQEQDAAVWSADVGEVIRRYAKSNTHGNRARRLIRLGEKLYDEGI
jgi:DNA repair exonuclease SbcCD nuclease subunit